MQLEDSVARQELKAFAKQLPTRLAGDIQTLFDDELNDNALIDDLVFHQTAEVLKKLLHHLPRHIFKDARCNILLQYGQIGEIFLICSGLMDVGDEDLTLYNCKTDESIYFSVKDLDPNRSEFTHGYIE